MPGRASFDLAAHRTATTGTGALTLGVVSPGWLTLTAVGAADGVEVSYTIRTGAVGSYKYEQGWGIVGGSRTTVTRNAIRSSDGVGVALNLAGTSDVFFGPQLTDLVLYKDSVRGALTGGKIVFGASPAYYDAFVASTAMALSYDTSAAAPGAEVSITIQGTGAAVDFGTAVKTGATNFSSAAGVVNVITFKWVGGVVLYTVLHQYSTALASATDTRAVVVVDGSIDPAAHSWKVNVQWYTGATIDQMNDIVTPVVRYHADGTTPWIGRVSNDMVARLKQGQAVWSGNTTRAEYFGQNDAPGTAADTFEENSPVPYFIGYRFRVGSDIVTNTGVQSWGGRNVLQMFGTHSIGWGSLPNSSGRDMALFLTGNQLDFIITPPGSGPGQVYDVRTTPLSTTVIDTTTGGGISGDERIWRLLNLAADEYTSIIIEVLPDNGDDTNKQPYIKVWTKQGSGALTLRINHQGKNTFSNGSRYAKVGLYSFDGENISAWWGDKNTRTLNINKFGLFRGDGPAGAAEPVLNQNTILSWLES
jgi:hypothetical protein